MRQPATLLGDRQEYTRVVANWTLQIIAYRLGEKFVCIVNNVDPGATICRVSAPTRDRALREGLHQANVLLSQTVILDAPKAGENYTQLSRIVFQDAGKRVDLTVAKFLELPIQTRMEHILSGNPGYFDIDDRPVPAGDAMKLLHKASTAAPQSLQQAA